MTSIDISKNIKLKEVNLDNNSLTSLYVFNNIDLESLSAIDNSIEKIDVTNNTVLRKLDLSGATVTTGVRAKKTGDSYTFDLSRIPFLWAPNNLNADWTPVTSDKYTYDPTTKIITVPNRENLASGFELEQGALTITISANPAAISVSANIGDVAIANIAQKYVGEAWDSDDYLDTIIAKLGAHGIEGATLTKVEAFNYSSFYYDERPNINVGASEDSTATHVYGTILSGLTHPNIEIVYYFEDDKSDIVVPNTSAEDETSIATPDTGAFTSSDKGLIAGISATVISAIGIVLYISRYVVKRQKSQVHFDKK